MKFMVTAIAQFFCMAIYSQKAFTIYFDFNKYNLTGAAKSQLDSFLLAEKQELANLSIQLNGHCDAIGSDGYNNRLSRQRVRAVKKYLLSNDLEDFQIGDEIGHGKRIPLNKNKNEEERQLNRRVEISFVVVVRTSLPLPKEILSLKETLADSATITGSTIILRNINFIGGMHQFLPESEPMLNELLEAMRTFPHLVIRVEGHICCVSGNGDGRDLETGTDNLSEARAKAVMDYLLSNGIELKRVSHQGFGHSAPIYPFPEPSELERIQNRRVEIKIISK